VNLEDFKSFRRVLKPPGVGSIPTHSRQFVGAALGALAVGLAATGARAAEPVPPGTPSPFARAMRSAAFPAWGQVTNGKSKKAVILFTAQTYVFTRVIEESRAAHESDRRANALLRRGDEESLASAAIARASAQDHFDTRRDLLFWALIGAFYGAVDAYVDAHLGSFGAEVEKDRGLFGAADPAERRVELGVRF
jgi:hypothetical protein